MSLIVAIDMKGDRDFLWNIARELGSKYLHFSELKTISRLSVDW